MERRAVTIGGQTYEIDILRRCRRRDEAVSIVQPSHNGRELTRVSLESIRRYTSYPYELWVVDNVSDDDTVEFLKAQSDINLILNHTPPWKRRHFWEKQKPWWEQPGGGSYANGVALQLAAQFVETRYMFVMHNDALPCKSGWLEYLLSKMTDQVRGVGVRQDKTRVHAMHQSGFLFDFDLFHPLRMSFMPNDPEWDVGDLVTVRLRGSGFQCFVCDNSFSDPDLLKIPSIARSWLRGVHCDKAIDDNNEVLYLHLGRGTLQAAGPGTIVRQTSVEQWLTMVSSYLLNQTT